MAIQVEGGQQASQIDAAINQVYMEMLGRTPDPSGMEHSRGIATYRGLLSPGGLDELRKSIRGSEEYLSNYNSTDQQNLASGVVT